MNWAPLHHVLIGLVCGTSLRRDVGDAMSKFEADASSVSLPDPVWVMEGGGAPTWSEFLETMKVSSP